MKPYAKFVRSNVCLDCGDDARKCGCESEGFCHDCLQPNEACLCPGDWDELSRAEEDETEDACPWCGGRHLHLWKHRREDYEGEGSCCEGGTGCLDTVFCNLCGHYISLCIC